jgi:hypothetical protein
VPKRCERARAIGRFDDPSALHFGESGQNGRLRGDESQGNSHRSQNRDRRKPSPLGRHEMSKPAILGCSMI